MQLVKPLPRAALVCAAIALWSLSACSSDTPAVGIDAVSPPPDSGPGGDSAVTPDGPVTTPDGPVVTPDGPVVTPDGPVVTPDGPVVTPDGPVVTPDGPVSTSDLPLPPSDAAVADVLVVDAAPPPAGCGNGVREGTEECDDGNTTNLDGCSSGCMFEQLHRINYLLLESGTDSFCGDNAFGKAIVNPLARDQLQAALDDGVQSGSMSVLMQFLALDDLTGQADALLSLGLLSGPPVVGVPGYDGNADLDWWYTIAASGLDATRTPLAQLNGSITAGKLTAGPGVLSLPVDFGGGQPAQLKVSHGRITADLSSVTAPTVSAATTPGHLAAEQLDPALKSFDRMGAQSPSSQGKLCGNVAAFSLKTMALPDTLASGPMGCQEGYGFSNTLLDVFVGGCTIFFIGQVIAPTQPDTHDPMTVAAGAGPPYTLSLDATKTVSGCKDRAGSTVDLNACLQDAAFSVFFRFASGRVIGK